ncbi:cold-regulated protein 27-like [Oryza brachyantha]|uniref:cold-regulated protein 27-like n=1 Tax=Oryza brachyantha TaxID=4533 RepID=UPI0007765237|nr:cold-regulated protein 27-like [Oryza brachyantha]
MDQPPGLADITSAGSSNGWTDEKHMLYISSLEESFVTQLYDGKVNSKAVFCRSSSVWGHGMCNENRTDNIVAQEFWGLDEVDGAASRASQTKHIGSTSCYGHQEDSKSYFMGDDASTTEPRQERISYRAKRNSHGLCSASSFHWHGQSSSWITELSDQNFSDEETEIRREQTVACSNKRLKHAPPGTNMVASPGNANLEGYYSGSSSDLDIGLLYAETASPSWKSQGQRTWSV